MRFLAWLAGAWYAAGAAMAARTLWRERHRQPAPPPPERDALTELADLEAHFDAYAARIDRLYLREEHPQP